MSETTDARTSREAKTWLLLTLGGVAFLMFLAGFVLVLT